MEQQPLLLKKSFNNYLVILLFVAIGFVLYANTFSNQMFWDDDDNILKNQFIQSWKYFPKYFSENLIAGAGLLSNYWRPILSIVFSLEWHLWKDCPLGYHFVNISFHVADAVLLFFILFFLFKNRWLAVFTSLIFLVHPLQTEAVTYVSGLGDPLSVFFIFLGLLFYLKFRAPKQELLAHKRYLANRYNCKVSRISGAKPRSEQSSTTGRGSGKSLLKSKPYFLSLLMYILALMSKETAIVMPALIFISDFFFVSQNEELSFKDKLKKIGKAIWPFFLLAGVYILLRATVLNFINTFNLYNEENVFTSNFHVRLFTFFRVLTIYFSLLFSPFNLHMERSVEMATSLSSFSVIFGGLVFLGLLILSFTKFKQFPILSFGIFWFLIGLAPTSNLLVPVSGLLYEHWLYLPLIGIFLILVWIAQSLGEKYNLQKVLPGILIVFLAFLSILTMDRNRDWADPITFYNQTLKYAPNSYRVINNLGMAYADKENYEQAEKLYTKAISLVSSNPVAYHNLANIYRATGKIDLAVENYKMAISLDPKFSFSYNALVNLYLENKNYQEARNVLENYLGYSDSKIDTLFLLAQIAAEEKDFQAVLSYLERALAIEPGNQFIQTDILNIKNLIEPKK